MAGEYAFVMKDLRKVVPPKREILRGIYLSFFHGAKIGVLGANGAGKSTLLRIMAGVDTDILGEAFPAAGLRVGYLSQEPQLDSAKDVRANVEDGVSETRALLTRFEEVSAKLGEPLESDEMEKLLDEQARLQDKIDAANAWDLDRTVEMAMDALRVPPGDMDVAKISGGERRRVALCRLLLSRPDMLLLDEPTNHLDAESVAWLERYLKEYTGTVVAITHDRYFLDNAAGWILELDRGHGIPWEGNYSSWLDQKQQRLAQEEKADVARQRTLARELEWVQMSPRARQAKSKARLQAYDALLTESFETRAAALEIAIPPGPRLGDLVVEADHVTKGYGDRVLIDDLSFKLPRGGIVGVIGPNGAGKTTLFRMIAGQEKPDSGTLRVGETVRLAYVDQSRDALDGKKTVWEEISEGAEILTLGTRTMQSRAYVASFNFRGSDQQKRVADLSGGERNRLHLAKILKSGANLLLLDEPTNDLDVDTLRALEDGLLAFAGCAVIISHDRWFLDRIATHVLAFEDEGRAVWFEGNHADYEADRRRRLGAEADRPHRLRFKRLK
ncbi:MAG: energy-dependent translational throttle protein EttA [Candidatus Rokuibacteriota bacterium]|nr:MAG: energy-dependent translational throttle protein EttA [Candidatus Rokubacteria bacterium]PYN16770.1 MAG: energy-dependent translational throttle protein EttA [Candidatus Rokubacteria bacterium]PYN55046.1 MAG: energy-dependent translational throttle protein EttA [Candidatus Rokubacteria bacterium]PYN74786.1 MAG: energy-dependent translational throttle protein EttA [Candidatus Rokubacteria bacterium]